MTREAEAQLFDFCVQQRERFSLLEWLRFRAVSKDTLATAALFLAGVDWYGHCEMLARIAEQLYPGSGTRFPEMVKLADFDCPRFSNMLRAKLRHEHAHA